MAYSIRVLIADDRLIAREGLRRILEREPDIEVVGEAEVVHETLRMVPKLKPDIVLMDLMWGADEDIGIDAIAKLKSISAATRIITITVANDLVADARRAGADAVVLKGFSRDELLRTIRAVYQSESFPIIDRGQRSQGPQPRQQHKPVDHDSPAYLLAAVGIPLLGFMLLAAETMLGVFFLSLEKFVTAIVLTAFVFFFGVVFAGRYVGVISETRTYQLFIEIIKSVRLRFPWQPKENQHKEGTEESDAWTNKGPNS